MKQPGAAGQHGMALIEALMASAVLAIGVLGATQLTLKTFQTATESRQNTVAQMLALEAMNCLQTPMNSSGAACPLQQSLVVQGVRYTRESQRSPFGTGQVTDLTVRVSWPRQRPMAAAAGAHAGGPNAGSSTPTDPQIIWHSSISSVPSWVGVSSP